MIEIPETTSIIHSTLNLPPLVYGKVSALLDEENRTTVNFQQQKSCDNVEDNITE